MKKNYLFLVLALCTSIFSAQSITFTNGGGDRLWSNTANWSVGVLPTSTNNVGTSQNNSIVDANFTIARIQNFAGTTSDVSYGGNGTGILTIDIASAVAALGIANFSDNDVALSFSGNITINNSDASNEITFMRNDRGTSAGNSIKFEGGSLLTLETNFETRKSAGGNTFNFDGTLAGTAALRFAANTNNIFGSTSDNTGHGGDLVWVGSNATVVVNTAVNSTFLPADRKIQINAADGSIEVNSENVYQGNISINGSNTFTFDVNKNQSSIGTITLAGGTANGTLNLDIDDSVTTLNFANSSEVDWSAGTLNISGFKNGVIRFGTDNNGLTAAQLTQITASGITAFALDNDGYLIDAATASVNDFEENTINPIAYPTLTSHKIYFRELQNNVKIFDITGKVLVHNTTSNQSEIGVENFSSGLYFIVFDNKKVERFVKN